MDPESETVRLRNAVANGVVDALWHFAWPRLRDAQFQERWARKREASRNPLVKCGAKYYSQNDEDGILREILRRIGLGTGVFVELGCGNGLENNTVFLLMSGWRGVWLDGEKLAFEVPRGGPLFFRDAWISRDNCRDLVAEGMAGLGEKRADLLSIDLDGNDLHILEALLASGMQPEVLVCEYNAKFPPPIRFAMAYDPNHKWDMTDYYGASLQSLADLLAPRGYRPVACNLTGVNAFFVHEKHAARFADVPTGLPELFVEADYNWFVAAGHAPSPRTVAQFLRK